MKRTIITFVLVMLILPFNMEAFLLLLPKLFSLYLFGGVNNKS